MRTIMIVISMFLFACTVKDPELSRVLVLGDSLVVNNELCNVVDPKATCAVPLTRRLKDQGNIVNADYLAGVGWHSWWNVVLHHASSRPNVAALLLGTNDATRENSANDRPTVRKETLSAIASGIDAFRSQAPDVCIVLSTVTAKAFQEPAWHDAARAINDEYKRLSREEPGGFKIVDFALAAHNHCGDAWSSNVDHQCDWFTSDQLHLTNAGVDARNLMIVDAVASCR